MFQGGGRIATGRIAQGLSGQYHRNTCDAVRPPEAERQNGCLERGRQVEGKDEEEDEAVENMQGQQNRMKWGVRSNN